MIQQLLKTTGIHLKNGTGIPEPIKFQNNVREYKIVLYAGLNCDIMFQGLVESDKRINLLFDEVRNTMT